MSDAELRPEPTGGTRICSALPGRLPFGVLVLLPADLGCLGARAVQGNELRPEPAHAHSCWGHSAGPMPGSVRTQHLTQVSIRVSTSSVYNHPPFSSQTAHPGSGLPNAHIPAQDVWEVT